MILGKLWYSLKAQANKLVNAIWSADPIGAMQYEYDLAVAQLRDGREGLEQYRALVERVDRQVATAQQRSTTLEAKTKAYLATGDRETAAHFALEMQHTQQELNENEAQLEMHERAYEQNVAKIKQAAKKLSEVRERIARYNAELKMSNADAEISRMANEFNVDITTDFGRIEKTLQDKICLNRANVRVSSDLAGISAIDLEREQAMEAVLAEQALKQFESRENQSSKITQISPEVAKLPQPEK